MIDNLTNLWNKLEEQLQTGDLPLEAGLAVLLVHVLPAQQRDLVSVVNNRINQGQTVRQL